MQIEVLKKMEKLKGKTVLVTGAAGFIGSHLAEELALKDVKVRALIHYNSRNDCGNLKWVEKSILEKIDIFWGDIRDPFLVREAVRGCEIVFHLAALIAIPYSYIAPKEYVHTNVLGTLNVLEACRLLKVKRVIHTSTSEVYGTAVYTPIDENHPLQGQSPYSASKIAADKIVESYYCSFDLPVVTIRPFNTFGPRQSQRSVIPTIISQILAGKKNIQLGSVFPVRDLIFVKDTVNGFLLATVVGNLEGEVINLGFGKGISIGELVSKIAELCGAEVSIEQDAKRVRPDKSEVLKLICNNEKAKLRLGWEPKVTLDEGLKAAIQFISENLELYLPEQYTI